MLKIKNIHNAFTFLEYGNTKVVIDPWITNGIYHNSWCISPDVNVDESIDILKKTNFCIVSHIHEDHFDINAINNLPEECKIVLPNLWPNNIVAKRKIPNRSVIFINVGEEFKIEENIKMTFVQPMNGQGHLSKTKIPDASDDIVLDTAVLIECADEKILFLCDNFPWDYTNLEKIIASKISNCKIIFAPFNSFADDYPVCFDNFTKIEKLDISTKRNNKRLKSLSEFINCFQPQHVVPYSSDFFIKGKRAIEFDECHPDDFKSRKDFSKKLSMYARCPILPVSTNQTIYVKSSEVELEGEYVETNFRSVCENLYSEKPNEKYLSVPELEIDNLITSSSKNMFEKMKKLTLETDWVFQIQILDQDNRLVNVDPKNRLVFEGETDRKFLRCIIESGHLALLLNFKNHWDNERISHNLTWYRSDDIYEPNINKSINFFHK